MKINKFRKPWGMTNKDFGALIFSITLGTQRTSCSFLMMIMIIIVLLKSYGVKPGLTSLLFTDASLASSDRFILQM